MLNNFLKLKMNFYNNVILKQVFTSVIINTTQCSIWPIFTLNFMLDRNNTNNVAIYFDGCFSTEQPRECINTRTIPILEFKIFNVANCINLSTLLINNIGKGCTALPLDIYSKTVNLSLPFYSFLEPKNKLFFYQKLNSENNYDLLLIFSNSDLRFMEPMINSNNKNKHRLYNIDKSVYSEGLLNPYFILSFGSFKKTEICNALNLENVIFISFPEISFSAELKIPLCLNVTEMTSQDNFTDFFIQFSN